MAFNIILKCVNYLRVFDVISVIQAPLKSNKKFIHLILPVVHHLT